MYFSHKLHVNLKIIWREATYAINLVNVTNTFKSTNGTDKSDLVYTH